MRSLLLLTLFCLPFTASVVKAQVESTPSPIPSASPTASPSESDTVAAEIKNFREGLKSVSDGSNILLTWALAIIAGSIITIVSTSYLRPPSKRVRYIYLLFIPGWLCMGLSIFFGNHISRRYIAGTLVMNTETLDLIETKILADYGWQLFFVQIGLLFFSVWLICFLIWWIFGNLPAKAEAS